MIQAEQVKVKPKPLNASACPFCGVVVNHESYIEHVQECDAKKASN